MKTVLIETSFRQIGDRIYAHVEPTAPVWQIVNDGVAKLYLNNSYVIAAGDRFGIDATAIVAQALHRGIDVINETQFEVRFETSSLIGGNQFTNPDPFGPDFPTFYGAPEKLKSAQLIETTYRIVNE